MNFAAIKAKLDELNVDEKQLGYDDFYDWEADKDDEKDKRPAIEAALGKFSQVAQKGGEGQGEEWWSVIYFEDHDVYIRVDGYYSSYDGTYFDKEMYEVRPQQKTITVYE